MKLLNDFISLFFPHICLLCNYHQASEGACICLRCEYHLPETNYHHERINPVSRIFWGRAHVESAAAFLFFQKSSHVQKLIHQFKYKGKKQIGTYLGMKYGLKIRESKLFQDIDFIVPVPLHWKKEKRRGYNQSMIFSQGLSCSMAIKICDNVLFRKQSSSTQTRKSRYSRWENVEKIFDLHPTHKKYLEDKHILLVDDVITTGSTLEACIHALQEIPKLKISVAAIAFAKD